MYILLVIFGIIFIIFFGLFFNIRNKRQILRRVYSKLSNSDKQVFHVVRATERRAAPTLQNILTIFYNINKVQIQTEQLLQRLYRLENQGLVKMTISYLEGHPVQICTSLYSEQLFSKLISKRYKLVTSIFLPLSIITSIICYYLLQFLDLIVHGDLYEFGLVFSYEWANQYWNFTGSIRTYIFITLFLLTLSLFLTVVNFRSFKKVIKIIICTFFMVGLFFVSYSAFLLYRLDFLVNYDLYNYGLQFSYNWIEPYWIYLSLLYILFGLSIVAIILCFIFCSFSKLYNHNN